MKFWLENEFEEVVLRLHTFDSDKQTNVEQRVFRTIFFFVASEWMFIVKTILDTLCYNVLAIALMQDYMAKKVAFKIDITIFGFISICVSVCAMCVQCVFIQVFLCMSERAFIGVSIVVQCI